MSRPNILFIMSDDHAAQAMSCYGSRINETPHIDRIAKEGMTLNNCFCTNSICTPSRATILTGKYSHMNGVLTLSDRLNTTQPTFPVLLSQAGYQTAMIGKWHLAQGKETLTEKKIGSPEGVFDYWNVLPGQGDYRDPLMIEMGREKQYAGYVTDIITDRSQDWLENRDKDRPFLLMCHHKAPHRPWVPAARHSDLYAGVEIPEPETFDDDYQNRAQAAQEAKMRIAEDLNARDLKEDPPAGLAGPELKKWKYQRYIKDYLRCVAAIDENVGRLLDYLKKEGLSENTLVIYTSDQGFFLGEHGWYDKRFFYEESLRMPFVVRYPSEIDAGRRSDHMALNTDFAETFLDYAGVEIPDDMQGKSLRPVLSGTEPKDWRKSMYYRYWMHLAHHNVYAHYGLRTERYKLIYYYADALGTAGSVDEPKPAEWELFDLEKDPLEMENVYGHPDYRQVVKELKEELFRRKREVGDYR